jgi:hypothetical protein
MPAGATGEAYWKGWDIARGIVLDSAGTGGYTLDGYGGIHPFAIGSNKMPADVKSPNYTPGWDVADGLAIGKTELAVVNSNGGVHEVAS